MKYFKKNKGITLIALVITIIVMLILVGVTLSMISGENGIFGKAEKAVDETSSASMKEDVEFTVFNLMADYYSDYTNLAASFPKAMDYVKNQCETGIQTNSGATLQFSDGKFQYIRDSGKVAEVEIDDDGKVGGSMDASETQSAIAGKNATSKNRTLANATTGYSYKNPVIPQGFKAVNVGSAKWEYEDSVTVKGWDEGLVIQDASNGNQFVWVPCTNGSSSEVVTYQKDFSLDSGDSRTASDTSDDTSVMPSGITEDTQIGTYGGFYVARFEAGIPSSGTDMSKSTNNVTTYVPVSKAGSKVWNYIDYDNAATVSKAMVNNTSTYGNNKSGLITGKQWDTIMAWYKKAGIGVEKTTQNWGSCKDLTYTISPGYCFNADSSQGTDTIEYSTSAWTQNSSNISHIASTGWFFHGSGQTADGIKKNIADIGGNVDEWSAEIYSSRYLTRGSDITSNVSRGPASCRTAASVDDGDYFHGFCPVLYVQ